jgi:hypothetical protein
MSAPASAAAPAASSPAASDDDEKLGKSISTALTNIDKELAKRLWLFVDPERRKALSRSRDFLQRIEESRGSSHVPSRLEATTTLVNRVATDHARYGRENAWDFAEELRLASYFFESDEDLVALLSKESADTTRINYKTVFGGDIPAALLDLKTFNREHVLAVLARLHHERVDRVRHDRARDKLWQQFAWKLIPVIAALLGASLYFYLAHPTSRVLPVLAGALGSVLSAVLKMRDGEQRIRQLRRWASFIFVQPMIGAAAALVMTWIGVDNVLKLDPSNTNAAVLLGFVAGFSEPFFLGTIARLGDFGAGNGKSGEPADQDKKNSAAG